MKIIQYLKILEIFFIFLLLLSIIGHTFNLSKETKLLAEVPIVNLLFIDATSNKCLLLINNNNLYKSNITTLECNSYLLDPEKVKIIKLFTQEI